MKTGISSLIFTRMKNDVDIFPFLKAASDKGIKYIEYSDTNHPSLDERDEDNIRKVKNISDDYGISIISVHIPPLHDIGALDKCQRETSLQNIKNNLLNASIMGAQYAVLHPPYIEDKAIPDQDSIKKCFLESLPEILEEAKMRHIMVLLENTIGKWCGNIEAIRTMIKKCKDNIGFCLDIGHCLIEKYDPDEILLENADIVKYLHVHDNNGIRDMHLVTGEGIANWDKIFDALLKVHFSGIFMIESVASSSTEDPQKILDKVKNAQDINEKKYPFLYQRTDVKQS